MLLRKSILFENHDSPTPGHLDYFKTRNRVTNCYYWPKINSDIARYVRQCEICKEQKPEQKLPQGVMYPRTISYPWEVICTDFIVKREIDIFL